MSLGPFLKRTLITSVRRGTIFSERRGAVLLMAAIVAGCVLVWDWRGWDRSSSVGVGPFALAMFGVLAAAQIVLVLGLVPTLVAPSIASERDRKSLDALLASGFSSADIVLGAVAAGLSRSLNSLVALGPVLVLMVFLGGIDPRLLLLAVVGLASTAFAVAALATAVSAVARSTSEAVSLTIGLMVMWLCLPLFFVILLPRLWPGSAPWVAPIGMAVLDSSPVGVAVSLRGLIWRGPLTETVPRMIAIQTVAAVGLISWAIARLRPASRAVYDEEGRLASLRLLKARWRPRPACGDDPVLWREIHTPRAISPVMMLWDRVYVVLGVGLLAYLVSWFAIPAFAELFEVGYGPMLGNPVLPEVHPIARVLVAKLSKPGLAAAPGQARLEFNIVLRQVTLILDLMYVFVVAGYAAEAMMAERERETWLGLIATPLTGLEILRAKMLGAIWKARGLSSLMLALWLVGLMAGALHPVGFLSAVVGLVVSSWFLAALGVFVSLWSSDRNELGLRLLMPVGLLVGLSLLPFASPSTPVALLAAGLIPFQTWATLLSFEDIHALTHAVAPPQFAAVGVGGIEVSGIILAAGLISMTAQAVGAFLLTRSAGRGFDAAVGRPVRPRNAARRERPGSEGG